ncbi:MAG: sigma-E processing peptidase SpoIIGA [Clostridiales bacterium]|nr:sigma-E processing peptidase SpoIIGA [Clostridiales bacterium]
MRVVYADVLFVINLMVNYLLLAAVCKIRAFWVGRLRLALSAATGAAYAVAAILPGLEFLRNPVIKIGSGVLMFLCAFGGKKGLLKTGLIFAAVTAAFGGIVMAVALLGGEEIMEGGIFLPINLRSLLLTLGLAYGILTAVFRFMAAAGGRGGYVTLEIWCGDKKVRLPALKDTGNMLRDPLTGIPVPIIEDEAAAGLFEKEVSDILLSSKSKSSSERMELLWEREPGLRFRLIPYSAVGVKSDMLLAFKPDRVKLAGREMRGMWIALSPTRVSNNGTHSALVCADIA